MKVIVDTCTWSQFLRRNRPSKDAVAEEVARLVCADAVQMIGPIRQELLSGAQPSDRFEQLKEYLRFYPNLKLEEEDDETAARYYNYLRARGVQTMGTDLLICAAAVRRDQKVFSTDKDLAGYARHIPVNLHRAAGLG